MQNESRKPVPATFCRPPRNAVRPEPSPRHPCKGNGFAKGQTEFARRRTPSRTGKAFRGPVFPFIPHPQELPCGRKVSPLRKAVRFFAENDSVFTAKKHPPGRRNAPYKQFLHPFFNSPLLFAALRPAIETRKRKESLSFGRNFCAWMTIRRRMLSQKNG